MYGDYELLTIKIKEKQMEKLRGIVNSFFNLDCNCGQKKTLKNKVWIGIVVLVFILGASI